MGSIGHGIWNRGSFQRMPRARLRRVRPEEEEELVPAAALLSRRGKYSEQRQSAALKSGLAEKSVVLRGNQ